MRSRRSVVRGEEVIPPAQVCLVSLRLLISDVFERIVDMTMFLLLLSSIILFAVFVSAIRPQINAYTGPNQGNAIGEFWGIVSNTTSYIGNRSQLSPIGSEIPIMPPLIVVAPQLSIQNGCETAVRWVFETLANNVAEPNRSWFQPCGSILSENGSNTSISAKVNMSQLPLDWPEFRVPREIRFSHTQRRFLIWYRNESLDDFLRWFNNQPSIDLLSLSMTRLYIRPDDSIVSESFQLSNSGPQPVRYGSIHFASHPYPSYPLLISLALFIAQVLLGIMVKLKWQLPFALLDVVFATFFCACACFRLYLSSTRPVEQLVDKLDVADPLYIQSIDELFTWFDWHMFIYTLESWGILLSITLLFKGFAVNYMHFAFLFFLAFFGIAVIGWLSLGDEMGWTSLQDVLVVQFAMISSNWPPELVYGSRPVLFILWSGSVITIIYCMLYNFYQTLLEKDYRSTSWWGSSFMRVIRTRNLNKLRVLRILKELEKKEGQTIPLSRLQEKVSSNDWDILETNGYISKSIVASPVIHPRAIPNKYSQKLKSLLMDIDSITTWLCLNSRPRNQLRDKDLMSAIEKSFRSVEQKMASTVLRPSRDKKLGLD